MSIDEAIEKFKFIANSDDPCPRYCMLPCDKCVDESKQIADWLEELNVYQQHEIICNKGYNSGYNKAIDDYKSGIKEELERFEVKNLDTCVLYNLMDRKAEQLKGRR